MKITDVIIKTYHVEEDQVSYIQVEIIRRNSNNGVSTPRRNVRYMNSISHTTDEMARFLNRASMMQIMLVKRGFLNRLSSDGSHYVDPDYSGFYDAERWLG